MLGKRETQKNDRGLQVFLHRDHRPDRTAFASKGRSPSECRLHSRRCGLCIRPFELADVRLERRQELGLDVGILLLHKVSNQLEYLPRLLIGNQPATDLGLRVIRHDRFNARTLITAGDAVYFERRLRHDRFEHSLRIIEPQLFQLVRSLESFRREARVQKALKLAFRSSLHLIIEALDPNAAGRGVEAFVDDLAQFRHGISSRASGEP